VFSVVSPSPLMTRGNRLVETVELCQQVVTILKGDGVTRSEENRLEVVGHGVILTGFTSAAPG